MAKAKTLQGDLIVHVPGAKGHDLLTLKPGDEIPEWAEEYLEPALRGDTDEEPSNDTGAPAGGNAGSPENPTKEQLLAETVPDLKKRLDGLKIEYASGDRKDDLVDKILQAQAAA